MRLSPSQIATYRRCSLQWFFSYVCRIKMKPKGSQTQGSAVHFGIQVALVEKLESGSLPPASVVMDATSEAFEKLAPVTDFGEEKPDELKDQAVELSKLHHAQVAPEIGPIFVEHKMEAALEDGLTISMVADVVEQDGTIRDHKVSGRKIDRSILRVDPQLAAYTLGFEQTMGMPIRAVRLDRLLTTKTPSIQQEEIPREEVDTQRLRRVSRAVASGIEQKVFVPVDDPKVCGWCGYREICWGARWWDYLENPDLARDAAARVLAGKLLPQEAASLAVPETTASLGGGEK